MLVSKHICSHLVSPLTNTICYGKFIGKTALQWAQIEGNDDVVIYLEAAIVNREEELENVNLINFLFLKVCVDCC